MAKAQDCPVCGLVNPPSAQRCDCGYDFVARRLKESYAGTASIQGPSLGELALCILIPWIGLFVGMSARNRGRREAGRVMVIVSGAVLAVCLLPFLLLFVLGFIGSLNR